MKLPTPAVFAGRLGQIVGVAVLAFALSTLTSPASATDQDSCGPSNGNKCLTSAQPEGYDDKYCSNTQGGGSCMTCYVRAGWICPSPYSPNPDVDGYSDTYE